MVIVRLLGLGASLIGTRTLEIDLGREPLRLRGLIDRLREEEGVAIVVDSEGLPRDTRGVLLSILVNSRHAHYIEGLDTAVRDGDKVSILTMLSGG